MNVLVVLGGVAGAGAKVTGSLGNVVAKLTFDKDHQESRIQDKGKQDSSILHRFGGLGKVTVSRTPHALCMPALVQYVGAGSI